MSNNLVLYGCAPEPLLHYLKALGIFRLVAEQRDTQVRSAWQGDTLHLETRLTADALVEFFLHEYSPTPIVAPWNGGSGFYPQDKNQRALLDTLCNATSARLAEYRATIATARALVGARAEQPKEAEKAEMLRQARRVFADRAVQWLDAAYVLGEQKPDYPPVLGSGGNDGRLDFTSNFIARLLAVLPEAIQQQADAQWQQQPTARQTPARFSRLRQQTAAQITQSTQQLRAALFRDGIATLERAAVGQFYPGGAGGVNATAGLEAGSFVNPWDFILALEGSMLLASATVRQLAAGARSRASFPFTTRNTVVGYGTASSNEKMRAEMWLPLWSRAAGFAEVAHIFSEGRVQSSASQRRMARTGFDFARAVAELGVDRGIEAFQRYGFLERNGQANLAAPLGRIAVQARPQASLIYEFERWFDTLRRAANDPKRTPPRFTRALAHIEEASFQLCTSSQPSDASAILVALGSAEAELACSPRFREEHKELALRPLTGLSEAWISACDDQSHEFALAAALASITGDDKRGPFRTHLEPVTLTGRHLAWTNDDTSTVWSAGILADNLVAVLQRRSIEARAAGLSHPALASKRYASLQAIDAFLQHETDDERLEDLLRGLTLIHWPASASWAPRDATLLPPTLPRAYALLKLLFLPDGRLSLPSLPEPITIRHEPTLLPLLRAGRIAEALETAAQRLRTCGLTPLTAQFHVAPQMGVRLAAALLFPITMPTIRALAALVLRPVNPQL